MVILPSHHLPGPLQVAFLHLVSSQHNPEVLYVNTELNVLCSCTLQMSCSGTDIAMGPMVVRSFFYAVNGTTYDSSLATQD